ncbi:cytochrome c oxidase accessory protein FixG [Ferrimonas sediminum]|uniref:Cytochrome c oxidase accessory protein FixG n=1 Tax=Ferrimonas sediminum TaxID=718193 RepID=A0A1G8SDX0_9GAMM|nr:cytochrome c oxidase accessory protein CcoG [Ferrimonas sediminum]SDJ26945.1 cytochrome c oxidase accessory protein FixG [Ferrimonas sediminum]
MKPVSASNQRVVFRSGVSEGKIYIREQSGRLQRIRRGLNFGLVGLFLLLPLLRYQGHQAILFDLGQQRLDLFSLSLFPQDLMIVALLFILAAFVLFTVTKLYGRIWCGFSCPQTVWTLMFNWLERRIEGSHSHSRALDAQPWSGNKIVQKGLKHGLWLALSLASGLTFVSYFVPVAKLYPAFFQGHASLTVQAWVWFFTLCTYVNAGWLREKVCQHICPYARFQSVMFDDTTRLLGYDAARGESRGPRKRGQNLSSQLGDCVDCDLCVQVCPVGIDIRDGLQYPCISCGLCIDACDQTMDRFNYSKGLIRFTSSRQGGRSATGYLGYGVGVLLTILAIMAWSNARTSFEVNVIRDRQALYRVNSAGFAENTFKFKALNKTQQPRTYGIIVQGVYSLAIEGDAYMTVAPGEHQTHVLTVALTEDARETQTPIRFVVVDVNTGEHLFRQSTFYAGTAG